LGVRPPVKFACAQNWGGIQVALRRRFSISPLFNFIDQLIHSCIPDDLIPFLRVVAETGSELIEKSSRVCRT